LGLQAAVKVQGPTHDSLAKSSFHRHGQVTHSAFAYIYLSISTKGARGVLAQLYVHRENKRDYFVMTYPKTPANSSMLGPFIRTRKP
jgi:hypothetical protein